jgi:hypothetical protein
MTTTTIKREMLHVTYSLDESFKIPIGVDLNDTSQVKNWSVKWNILYITYADGRIEEIAAEGLLNYEYPVPESVNVVSVDEHGNMIDEDDCEDEDDDEYDYDCDDCPECGKGLTDLSHKRDKGYVGDYMICDACYEDNCLQEKETS